MFLFPSPFVSVFFELKGFYCCYSLTLVWTFCTLVSLFSFKTLWIILSVYVISEKAVICLKWIKLQVRQTVVHLIKSHLRRCCCGFQQSYHLYVPKKLINAYAYSSENENYFGNCISVYWGICSSEKYRFYKFAVILTDYTN